jgi:hypothetical protein
MNKNHKAIDVVDEAGAGAHQLYDSEAKPGGFAYIVSVCAQVCQLTTRSIAAAVFDPMPSTLLSLRSKRQTTPAPCKSVQATAWRGPGQYRAGPARSEVGEFRLAVKQDSSRIEFYPAGQGSFDHLMKSRSALHFGESHWLGYGNLWPPLEPARH